MKKNGLFLFVILIAVASCVQAQTYSTVSTYAGTSVAGLQNGPLNSAQFNAPYTICMDPATGYFYVGDVLNHCIRKIANGQVTTLAGNGTPGDVDAQGANARFNSPAGICFDNGYIYLSDNGNNKVKRVDTLGNVVTFAGTGSAGTVDGPALQAEFFNPANVLSDHYGSIYVADYGNHSIRKITNGQVTTFAGISGTSGDQLGAAATALFNRPTGLLLDAQGNLYVADQVNCKIKMIAGGVVSLVAGSGATASTDGTGANAAFSRPCYMDFDLYGNIVLTEWMSNKIRRVTPAGVVTTVAGTGSAGLNNGSVLVATFNTPYGICTGINGDLFVGDRSNNVIRRISFDDVGFDEQSLASIPALNFFPNPSLENVTIVAGEDHFSSIRIYDIQGKLCKSVSVQAYAAQLVISVADLAPGQYTIIAEGEKATYTGQLIRQ